MHWQLDRCLHCQSEPFPNHKGYSTDICFFLIVLNAHVDLVLFTVLGSEGAVVVGAGYRCNNTVIEKKCDLRNLVGFEHLHLSGKHFCNCFLRFVQIVEMVEVAGN